MTFSIVAALLLVSMLAFNDAQGRAEARVGEIQAASAAQRVAAAAIDLALASPAGNVSVALELPTDIIGSNYIVRLCDDGSDDACGDIDWCATHPCPYVRVEPARGAVQRQSTFLTAGGNFCPPADSVANGGLVYVIYNASQTCIGLSNSPV